MPSSGPTSSASLARPRAVGQPTDSCRGLGSSREVPVRQVEAGPGRSSIATRYFVDTNVWIYAVDNGEPDKRDRARDFIAHHQDHVALSTQVMVEFVSATTRRLGVSLDVARALVGELESFDVLPMTPEVVMRGVETARRHQLSIWDALIVEAAVGSSCDVLVTEDLNHGAMVRGIRIHNPFLE